MWTRTGPGMSHTRNQKVALYLCSGTLVFPGAVGNKVSYCKKDMHWYTNPDLSDY